MVAEARTAMQNLHKDRCDHNLPVLKRGQRLTIPKFVPIETHPSRQAHFPLQFAAVGER